MQRALGDADRLLKIAEARLFVGGADREQHVQPPHQGLRPRDLGRLVLDARIAGLHRFG